MQPEGGSYLTHTATATSTGYKVDSNLSGTGASDGTGLQIDYNKFTDRSQPYYTQQTSQAGYQEKHGMETNYISLRGLQVSPNYHGGLASPGEKKIFWKYRATMSAILENPTEIKSMWRLWFYPKPSYDDSVDSYPIPMEYVSDLIQRVVQVEMRTELQTQSDEINDGLDDNIRRRGAQVQK